MAATETKPTDTRSDFIVAAPFTSKLRSTCGTGDPWVRKGKPRRVPQPR